MVSTNLLGACEVDEAVDCCRDPKKEAPRSCNLTDLCEEESVRVGTADELRMLSENAEGSELDLLLTRLFEEFRNYASRGLRSIAVGIARVHEDVFFSVLEDLTSKGFRIGIRDENVSQVCKVKPLLDEFGNPQNDTNGMPISEVDDEGNLVPVLDADGNTIPDPGMITAKFRVSW